MKKSTVILIVTSFLALSWTLVFYWMAGTSILAIRYGKKPLFAITPPPADTDICISASAFSSLDISGSGVMVMISNDSSCLLEMKDHLKKEMTLFIEDSTLKIRIRKFSVNKTPDTLFLQVPFLRSVAMYSHNLKGWQSLGLSITNLETRVLELSTVRTSPVIFGNCRISSLSMEIGPGPDCQEITIAPSNRFDSLSVYIPGAADLRLGAGGTFKNDFRVSGSVMFHSDAAVLQRITFNHNP
jgi:hypothetical protein